MESDADDAYDGALGPGCPLINLPNSTGKTHFHRADDHEGAHHDDNYDDHHDHDHDTGSTFSSADKSEEAASDTDQGAPRFRPGQARPEDNRLEPHDDPDAPSAADATAPTSAPVLASATEATGVPAGRQRSRGVDRTSVRDGAAGPQKLLGLDAGWREAQHG